MTDISSEIIFQTTRSGGKGGQNVNKVETAVIGSFEVDASALLDDIQKATIKQKLSNRISKEGFLQVKSQTHRTQMANKEEVIEKMNELIENALKKKKRCALQPNLPNNRKKKDWNGKRNSQMLNPAVGN